VETYLENARAKTGKTWQDFRELARERGLSKHGEIIAWLKAEYGLGHGHANAVTQMILHADEPKVSRDDKLDAHFAGAKAVWRESYDTLAAEVKRFGDDVGILPVKSYINLQRAGRKFGIVQVTGKRLDIGIKNADAPFDARFKDGSAWNAMVTHRIQITDPREVDGEVIARLRKAYERAT
jgi:hypothetical protein